MIHLAKDSRLVSCFAAVALSATLLNARAGADFVTIPFQANVVAIETQPGVEPTDYIGSEIGVGTPATGTLTVDADAAPIGGGTSNGASYLMNDPPAGIVIEIDGIVVRSAQAAPVSLSIQVGNDTTVAGGSQGDTYTISPITVENVIGTGGLSDFTPGIALELEGGTGIINSTELLLTAEQLNAFPTVTFSIHAFVNPKRTDTFRIVQRCLPDFPVTCALLLADLAQLVVVNQDVRDIHIVFHRGKQLVHILPKPTIAGD